MIMEPIIFVASLMRSITARSGQRAALLGHVNRGACPVYMLIMTVCMGCASHDCSPATSLAFPCALLHSHARLTFITDLSVHQVIQVGVLAVGSGSDDAPSKAMRGWPRRPLQFDSSACMAQLCMAQLCHAGASLPAPRSSS